MLDSQSAVIGEKGLLDLVFAQASSPEPAVRSAAVAALADLAGDPQRGPVDGAVIALAGDGGNLRRWPSSDELC